MIISPEKQEELVTKALKSVVGRTGLRRCYLLGFDSGLVLTLEEIANETAEVITLPKNRRDQLRRVAWNNHGGFCQTGNTLYNFRLGFSKGMEAAQKEFAKTQST